MTTRLAAAAGAVERIAARLTGCVDEAPDACAAWSVGGATPALVARPSGNEELATVVAAVAEAGGALVPLGRGAHRGLGHAPVRYDLALVTDGAVRIRDYTPADMTVTVEAGVTIAELGEVLAREGQWLAIEPPLPAATTVGGLLAADRSGWLAASQGRVRDVVIGLGVVTAAGVRARAGGRVVKNVAGYDLMKLFVGSLGSLAVLTDATFKVRPLPERQHGLVARAGSAAAALAFGAAAGGALGVAVEGGLGGAASGATVVILLGGVDADVTARRARIRELALRHGAELEVDADTGDPVLRAHCAAARDFAASSAGDVVVRLACLSSRVEAVVRDAVAAAVSSRGTWQADPRRGIVGLALAAPTAAAAATVLAALARVADAHEAHLVVERWPTALASTVTVWHPLPPALTLMRRMKAALDPAGVLAPGRFVGRL